MKQPGDLTSVKIIDVGLAVKVGDDQDDRDVQRGLRKPADNEMIKGTPEYMVGPPPRSTPHLARFGPKYGYGVCDIGCNVHNLACKRQTPRPKSLSPKLETHYPKP